MPSSMTKLKKINNTEMLVNWNFNILLLGVLNGTTTLQNRLEVNDKTKYIPRHLSKRNKKASMLKAGLFIMAQIWKQARCPIINKRMNKQTVAYS